MKMTYYQIKPYTIYTNTQTLAQGRFHCNIMFTSLNKPLFQEIYSVSKNKPSQHKQKNQVLHSRPAM